MIKFISKVILIVGVSLLVYHITIEMSGGMPLFDQIPWIRPIIKIFAPLLIIYNIQRDAKAKKNE